MSLPSETFKSLVKAAAEQVIASAPELTSLDQAIGDGDHGTNMKRGCEAVLGKLDAISAQPLDEAFKMIGKTLVMTVGGASGPLYGSFFLAAGEALSHDKQLPDDLADVFGSAVNAVSARGRSQVGEKTMLDVLVLCAGAGGVRRPGGTGMTETVGIVIVSHSSDIAKGTADMVRQMVGSEVKVAFCGGNPDGGLGTSVPLIIDAINAAWSPKGVAVLVDLGGAETNSEMAVEMLEPARRDLVVVCNAPIVEGAVMAATEAAGGSSLAQVKAVAEELSAD